MNQEVNTVTGALALRNMGVTLMHEHILLLDNSMRKSFPGWFDEQIFLEKIGPVIRQCRELGIETLVDLSNINMGRDVRLYEKISRQFHINIIASTGLYYTEEAWQNEKPAEELAEYFCKDVVEGCEGTAIRAGIIKCATDRLGMTPLNKTQLRAAAICARKTNVPIYTHTIASAKTGLQQVELFEHEGVDLSKVVIGHIGDTNDLEYVEGLLKRGVFVGLDRFGSEHIWPEKDRIQNLLKLCERGWTDRLILSHDMPYYFDWGEHRFDTFVAADPFDHSVLYTHIHQNVLPQLRSHGMSEEEIHTLLVKNPARVFAGKYQFPSL